MYETWFESRHLFEFKIIYFAAPDQDDLLIIDSEDEGTSSNVDDDMENKNRKRKLEDKECISTKRVRTEQTEEQDEIIALDWTWKCPLTKWFR